LALVGRGLDKFNRQNDQFTHYTTVNGLANDLIMGILEDKKGRLGFKKIDPRD
jgi:hypothetical protein